MDKLKVSNTFSESFLDDKIVEPKYHRAQFISQNYLVKVPGCKHEILMETDPLRAIFWNNFDQFVADKSDAS